MSHGICATHRNHRLDCAAFDQLRARAEGRCEQCGTPEADTSRGLLFIDHDARREVAGHGNFVRGLLCNGCNSRLGQVDGFRRFVQGAPVWVQRPPTPAEQAYLARPFWQEPVQVEAERRRLALQARVPELVEAVRAAVARPARTREEVRARNAVLRWAAGEGLRPRDVATASGLTRDYVHALLARSRADKAA